MRMRLPFPDQFNNVFRFSLKLNLLINCKPQRKEERKVIVVKLSILDPSSLNHIDWIYAETNKRKSDFRQTKEVEGVKKDKFS